MGNKNGWIVSCAVMLLASQAFAQENLIVNGSFESPALPHGSYSYLDSIPGWSPIRGCAIELQNHEAGWKAESGNQLLELDSYCSTTVAQSLSTTPGAQYQLSFAYSPRPGIADNRIRVRWGGVVVAELNQSGVGLNDTHWTTVSIPVTATAYSYSLEFEDPSYSDSFGGFIDNVQLVQKATCSALGTRQ
ncbi:DUF642 domain-containing protein [Archangium violaceum]|uniref:DUF642 domain-containing protein n=1 Tax=Archangium violaceum TaxID=83451 RepID=UPI00193C6A6C|nr:DUF642 domain-containing protein [Archangium violaceum]QRK08253.1 DUF642 domain-containing protein [Archangium violaceum]